MVLKCVRWINYDPYFISIQSDNNILYLATWYYIYFVQFIIYTSIYMSVHRLVCYVLNPVSQYVYIIALYQHSAVYNICGKFLKRSKRNPAYGCVRISSGELSEVHRFVKKLFWWYPMWNSSTWRALWNIINYYLSMSPFLGVLITQLMPS